ncbi:B3 DNA-binding domain protein [Medicago truncatula]|uniref:B3 DNA-binding domain protein n=1 Tax=Medicago truncatula TaxID=3880 RepID=G7IYF0_MEDTR|nr:B3 DNA-binding domain protein [Medicago truncatula]
MQARRRSSVRPPAPEKDSKHFMKAILPSPIHDTQIRIPDGFIKRFGNELKNVATITVPDGCDWEMELKKCGNDVYFCNKWQQFAEYYSIGYGSFLRFKYEGDSKFNVVIFDVTSVEICYPFKTQSINGETNTKCHSPRKRSKVETSDNHASKRSEEAAKEFNPKNPYFCSKILKRKYVYVNADFASKYLKPNVPIKIQTSHGEQWEVFGILHDANSSSAMKITRGFSIFQRDNNLSHGDYCVFELIKNNPLVLKVTMFRAADYGD